MSSQAFQATATGDDVICACNEIVTGTAKCLLGDIADADKIVTYVAKRLPGEDPVEVNFDEIEKALGDNCALTNVSVRRLRGRRYPDFAVNALRPMQLRTCARLSDETGWSMLRIAAYFKARGQLAGF